MLRVTCCDKLVTLEPFTKKIINTVELGDITAVDVIGRELVLTVAAGTRCGLFCGLLCHKLHFILSSPEKATTACFGIRKSLTRYLTAEDIERARVVATEAALVSAMPREQSVLPPTANAPRYGDEHRTIDTVKDVMDEEVGDDMVSESVSRGDAHTFDVFIKIQKGRSLPPPPMLCSSPRVVCRWGVSMPSSEVDSTAWLPQRGRRSSVSTQNVCAHAEVLADGAVDCGVASSRARQRHAFAHDGSMETGHNHGKSELSAPVECTTPEGEGDICNPRWEFEACFGYRARDAELRARRLVLSLYHETAIPMLGNASRPNHFGTVSVPLIDIALGPAKYDLPVLTSSGSQCGRIVFHVQMVQQCRISILLPSMTCTMRSQSRHTSLASQEASYRETSYWLSAALTMAGELESVPTCADFDPKALRFTEHTHVQLKLPESDMIRTRLGIVVQASARAFDLESIHLCVWESANTQLAKERAATSAQHQSTMPKLSMCSGFGVAHGVLSPSMCRGMSTKHKLVGEVWLPVTKVHNPQKSKAYDGHFDEILWLHGQRIGRLEGVVRFLNGPNFVQLPGGFFTEMGIVPIAPIAAGPAGQHEDSQASLSEHGIDDSLANCAGSADSLQSFQPAPKGLTLPREVEMLVSLVHSLRKVMLDLHLDLHLDATDGGAEGRLKLSQTDPRDMRVVGATALGSGATTLASSLTGVDGASIYGRRHSVGHVRHRTDGEIFGRSASSDRLDVGTIGGVCSGRLDMRSHSLNGRVGDKMLGGHSGVVSGRSLAPSELAARRLVFLLGRLQLLLGMTTKESCKAFFYSSQSALLWTQRLMLKLWVYLVTQVDVVAFHYQPSIFETLRLLMLRGELDCSALQDAPGSVLEKYRKTLWETVGYVVSKLNHKAAPTEVRVFCSQALAMAFFRLPALRHTLLTTILPPGESRHKHVHEWNLPWSLHKAALRESVDLLATSSASFTCDPPCFRRNRLWDVLMGSTAAVGNHGTDRVSDSHVAPRRRIPVSRVTNDAFTAHGSFSVPTPSKTASRLDARFQVGTGSPEVTTANSDTSPPMPASLGLTALVEGLCSPPMDEIAEFRALDQWSQLWRSRLNSATHDSQRLLGGRYWRERLRKRGHCFFLWFEHWLSHVWMATGVQPGEEVVWRDVPGAPTLFKAFLIEMKQRPLHLWPESMVSCLSALLRENRQLLQVCVRILISRVSSLHLRPSVAVLKHLDVVMRSITPESLPQTFSAEPLIRMLHHLAESEHFKVAASALIFLYNHLDAFGESNRLKSLEWLHARFAKFSLHWSRVVRTIFFHIIVVKVLHWTPPTTAYSLSSKRVASAASLTGYESRSCKLALNSCGCKNLPGPAASSGTSICGGDSGLEQLLTRDTNELRPKFEELLKYGSMDARSRPLGQRSYEGVLEGDGSNHLLPGALPYAESLSSMREVDQLGFFRMRDLYTVSVSALGQLAGAAAETSPETGLGAGNRTRGCDRAVSGSGRGVVADGSRCSGAEMPVGKSAGLSSPPEGLLPNAKAKGARPYGGGAVSAAMSAARDATAMAAAAKKTLDASLQNTIADAAIILGVTDLVVPSVAHSSLVSEQAAGAWPKTMHAAQHRRTFDYAHLAWSEYQGVERKWVCAYEAMVACADTLGHSCEVGCGDDSSTASVREGDAMHSIRRSNSAPNLPQPQSPDLSLSLSMISVHVHEENDESGVEHDDW